MKVAGILLVVFVSYASAQYGMFHRGAWHTGGATHGAMSRGTTGVFHNMHHNMHNTVQHNMHNTMQHNMHNMRTSHHQGFGAGNQAMWNLAAMRRFRDDRDDNRLWGRHGRSDDNRWGRSDDNRWGRSDDNRWGRWGRSDDNRWGRSDDRRWWGRSDDNRWGRSDDNRWGRSDDNRWGRSDDNRWGRSDDRRWGVSRDNMWERSDDRQWGRSDDNRWDRSDDNIFSYTRHQFPGVSQMHRPQGFFGSQQLCKPPLLLALCSFKPVIILRLLIASEMAYANSLGSDETPSNSASHPDPCCLSLA